MKKFSCLIILIFAFILTGCSTNTSDQEEALVAAKDYLEWSCFSYSGLIDQLIYEGFTEDSSIYAANNCGADWNEQAVKSAKNYLNCFMLSKEELKYELVHYAGFTNEQANYALNIVYF